MKPKSELLSEYDSFLSLVKITGKCIKDITGYVSMEFGEPTFKLSKLILEDGTDLWFEGEHDFPYLTEGAKKFNHFDEQLQSIADEEEKEEGED